MTTNELIKANLLNEQIQQKRKLLNSIETGKIVGVTIRTFDDDKVEYSELTIRSLPKNAIKQAMIAHTKNELENLERQFEKFLTPRQESQTIEMPLDSIAA